MPAQALRGAPATEPLTVAGGDRDSTRAGSTIGIAIGGHVGAGRHASSGIARGHRSGIVRVDPQVDAARPPASRRRKGTLDASQTADVAQEVSAIGPAAPGDADDGEYELQPLRIDAGSPASAAADMLAIRAEYAGWELARVLRFPDGSRRVWLRRRRVRPGCCPT